MCISPNTLADGTQTACHKCWQCREQAINDWVGRCVAESKTAKATYAVTLTYGRNERDDVHHERSVILTYSDVQKYLKKLRFNGYEVRYLVAGEFGSLKGRAHWHICLFFKDKVPPHELDKNFMEEHWTHGYSFWTEPTYQAFRYNVKYIQKDMGDEQRQGHLSMSKKPPLGALYFQLEAERYVRQGLAPQSLEYRFPEVVRRKQDGTTEIVPFVLKDRSAEMFLQHYINEWDRVYPDRDYPKSVVLDEFFDAWKREYRKIAEWFAKLPPNLDAAQRVQVQKYLVRIDELGKDREGLPLLDTVPFPSEPWEVGKLAEAMGQVVDQAARRKHLRSVALRADPEQWPSNYIGNRREG